jgi:manganese transport protein
MWWKVFCYYLWKESDDLETRKDKEKLDDYVSQLIARGYVAEGKLGFKNRSKKLCAL